MDENWKSQGKVMQPYNIITIFRVKLKNNLELFSIVLSVESDKEEYYDE